MLAALLMAGISARRYVELVVRDPHGAYAVIQSWVLYSRTVISPNYFDLGFVRRGLGGTIAHLLSSDFVLSSLLFEAISVLALVSALAVLIEKIARTHSLRAGLYMATVVALSPQTFFGWSRDAGRTDLLMMAFISWAVVCTLNRRPAVGVALVLAGALLHETAVVFGAPLLFVLNLMAVRERQMPWRAALRLLALLLVGLAAIVLAQKLLSPPPLAISSYMLSHSPHGTYPAEEVLREIAVYMMVADVRGLKTAICWNNDWDNQYYADAAIALSLVSLYLIVFNIKSRWASFLFSSLVPLLSMILIASDTGRWVKMAVLNAWLLSAFLQVRSSREIKWNGRALVVGGTIAAGLLCLGATNQMQVNKRLHTVLRNVGLQEPKSFEGWMDHCDPTWRQVIYGQVDPRARRTLPLPNPSLRNQ